MIINKNKEPKKLYKVCVFTSLFWFAAHAFCFFNTMFSHDSLSSLYQKGGNRWQISLGRFLQPVYRTFRGQLAAPFLIGMLALLWLSLAVYIIVNVLELESTASIVLVCGFLATNAAVTLTNATYISWLDMFMLALLLSVLGVYMCRRYRFGFLFGALCISLSLALYQSYFAVSVVLFLIVLLKMILDGETAKDVVLSGVKALLSLIIGLALYYIAFQIVLRATGISASADYNGIADAGDFSGVSLPRLLFDTYVYPVLYFLDPKTFNKPLSIILTGLIGVLTAAGVVGLVIFKRIKRKNIAVLAALFALIPFGVNVTYFISKGMIHALMIFSFFFLYVCAILITEYYKPGVGMRETFAKHKTAVALRNTAVAFMAVLLFNNIVYSNQIYLRKALEYQSTLSVMTRLIDRLEQTEGYEAGETPVAVIGSISWSPLSQKRTGFEDVYGTGVGTNYSISYNGTYRSYFEQILGYPINLVDGETQAALKQRPEVVEMPAFPSAESFKFIGDVLVIKTS